MAVDPRRSERARLIAALAAAVLGAVAVGAVISLANDRAGILLVLAAVVALGLAGVVFWRPMLGVYGAICGVPLELLRFQAGSSFSLTPTKALLLVTAAAIVTHVVLGHWRLVLTRAHLAFALFMCVVALGLIVAKDHLVTERMAVIWCAVLVVCIWVASFEAIEVKRLMICIALSAAVLGLIALAGNSPQQLQQGGAAAVNRASGSFTHPNQLGFYMVLALPVAIVLIGETKRLLRLVMIVCVGLIIGGLALTLARAAILGAAAAAVVLLAWPGYRKAMLVAVFGVVVAVVASPTILQNQEIKTLYTRLGTVQHVSQTSGNRVFVWRVTPSIIADHPLIGIGLGNFPIVSPTYGVTDYGQPFEHAQNVVLTIGAETGLIGLALFTWFSAAVALAGWRALTGRFGRTTKLALGLMAAYAGTFVIGLTDYPLGQDADFAVIMVEAALLLALGRQAQAEGTPAGRGEIDQWWRAGRGGVPRGSLKLPRRRRVASDGSLVAGLSPRPRTTAGRRGAGT